MEIDSFLFAALLWGMTHLNVLHHHTVRKYTPYVVSKIKAADYNQYY